MSEFVTTEENPNNVLLQIVPFVVLSTLNLTQEFAKDLRGKMRQ
jgi:hypothetical protein